MAKYKRRKDGRFRRSVTVGRKPDGSPDRKYAYGYTEQELEDNYAALRDSLNRGAYTNDEGLTVGEWAEYWFEAYKSDKEYNTRASYRSNLDAHIIKDLGGLRLREVKQYQVQFFLNTLTSAGKHRTAEMCRNTLKQMFDAAVDDNLIPKNPAYKIKLGKHPKPKRRQLTVVEKDAVEAADLTIKERTFLYFGMYSGLRRSETLALGRSDIDLASNTLKVDKGVYFEVNQARIKPYPKTDDSIRDAPIFPQLRRVLIPHLLTAGDNLFTMRNGSIMSKTSYRRMWESIEKKVAAASGKIANQENGFHITSHMLRHTFATTCYYAGIDIKQAARWLGHADTKMLMEVYAHLDESKEPESRHKFEVYTGEEVSKGSTEKTNRNGLHLDDMI